MEFTFCQRHQHACRAIPVWTASNSRLFWPIWAADSYPLLHPPCSFFLFLHLQKLGAPWGWDRKNTLLRGGACAGTSCLYLIQFSSVQSRHSVMSYSLQSHGLQHARLPCPSPTPGAYSNSCPLSWWWHPTNSSSVIPFSSCLQFCPTSGSFPVNQFFASGGLSMRVSASASVLPINIQDWFPLGLTGWISLQSKGLSRVFSNITVQKHQFFSTQLL